MNILINNKEQNRYEFSIDGQLAIAEYSIQDGNIYLTHTEVPESMKGKGIASDLIKQVFEAIEKTDSKIVPLCSFVVAYLKRHSEWQKLVVKGYEY